MRTRWCVVALAIVLPAAVLGQQPAPPPPVRQIGPLPGPGRDTLTEQRNPSGSDAKASRDGRRLFNWYNCSGCHGDHGGGGMGPSLRDSVWIYGGTDARIFNSINDGRTKGMPAWGTTLPAEQIWKLVTYIRTMRSMQEPDRP